MTSFLSQSYEKDLCNHSIKELVSPGDGRAIAVKINAVLYLEFLAKTKEGVNETFEAATRVALQV